ncbi:MAG: hypothetical protein ACOY4O_03280 [Pseudomonadota bacterium]
MRRSIFASIGGRQRRPGPLILAAAGLLPALPALAEPVPYSCTLAPNGLTASIYVTNTLDREASCLVNCKFSTAKYDDNPEITCVKPVPPGKEVEMCILRSSSGEKMLKLTSSRADCAR